MLLSVPAIDGGIFTVACFSTVVLRMSITVYCGLLLTNNFKNKEKLLKNHNEYSISIHKNSYMQIRCSWLTQKCFESVIMKIKVN